MQPRPLHRDAWDNSGPHDSRIGGPTEAQSARRSFPLGPLGFGPASAAVGANQISPQIARPQNRPVLRLKESSNLTSLVTEILNKIDRLQPLHP
jgi:hypothetical protein